MRVLAPAVSLRIPPIRTALRMTLAGLVLSLLIPVWLAGSASDAAAATCGPVPSSKLLVALVVDFGDGGVETKCVAVGEQSTGFDALKAAGYPRRIEGGFLCAIDGIPATGCSRNSGFDGWYWRYFKAEPGKAWRYSSAGAGYRIAAVQGCAVEGWVWSNSPDASVTPRGGVPSMDCSAAPAPPTTRAPVPSPPATTGPKSGAVTGSNGSGSSSGGVDGQPGSAPGSVGAGGSGGVSSPGSVDGSAPGGAPSAPDGSMDNGGVEGGPGAAGVPAPAEKDTESENPDGSGAEVKGASSQTSKSDSGSADASESASSETATAKRRAARSAGGSGSLVGSVVAAVLICGLILLAVVRARSRRAAAERS
ncbi:MAG TPA: hypothetical protein VL068_00260, partial [Microthrixaceae bacterium]|nr:hypothetical protein [Microthrixaceae bacterium]